MSAAETSSNAKIGRRKSINWESVGRTASEIGRLALQSLIMGAAGAAGAHAFNTTTSRNRRTETTETSTTVVPMRKSASN